MLAKHVVKKYPKGSEIEVNYDKTKSSYNVKEADYTQDYSNSLSNIFKVTSVIIIAIGIVLSIIGLFKML